MKPGVYQATKKDGTLYYRSNITYKGKHISLGSFSSEENANAAYNEASALLASHKKLEDFRCILCHLSFEKAVSLINFRDNRLYIANPIYLRKNYFSYYLSEEEELKFDIDDLFYYSSHKILRRKGHLYVNDYGMQVTLFSRYGIKNHSVCNRDYYFANGDSTDFRYSNIVIINPYHGVFRYRTKKGTFRYRVKLHINGNFTIGTYSTETKAAIAYNKAVDLAKNHGIRKNYPENYIEDLSPKDYADIYIKLKISDKFIRYLQNVELA
uniref:hypothetical protein n=1 Tax=Agathobacter sp. TaxID=2021311 RepID=UPI004057034E